MCGSFASILARKEDLKFNSLQNQMIVNESAAQDSCRKTISQASEQSKPVGSYSLLHLEEVSCILLFCLPFTERSGNVHADYKSEPKSEPKCESKRERMSKCSWLALIERLPY